MTHGINIKVIRTLIDFEKIVNLSKLSNNKIKYRSVQLKASKPFSCELTQIGERNFKERNATFILKKITDVLKLFRGPKKQSFDKIRNILSESPIVFGRKKSIFRKSLKNL